ncbi:MAG: helix-hairpin-helix domain-containing protein [Anaerolineales bacterium]|nr:helix-hairpin-helix domain-containing protein [Anaerolineales bacterium]
MAPRSRKVDLNTAPISDLLRVPQVGPALARAIMAARPYRRTSDLRHVAGVGEKLYFILRTHLSVLQPGLVHATSLESEAALPAVTSSVKLDLNSATVQELVALPGIGRAMAEAVVAQQPYTQLQELQRVSGVGPKLYAALREHLRVPRAAYSTTSAQSIEGGSKPFEKESTGGPAEEIDSIHPSLDEGIPAKVDVDTREAPADPLEVDTVQELIGPRIVDGRVPLQVDMANPAVVEPQPESLVTRELSRDWQDMEIKIGSRSRRKRWRLLSAAVIAGLILSVLQAYGLFGDAIMSSVFLPSVTQTAIVPMEIVPSVTPTEHALEPTLSGTVFAASTTSVPVATERATAATVEPQLSTTAVIADPTTAPTLTARPTSKIVSSATATASATLVPTATLAITIPQSVSDLDPPVTPVAVLWADDFEPPLFPWGTQRNETWDSAILDGVLRLSINQRGKLFYSTGPEFDLTSRDFLYEGDVIVKVCTGKDYYGLVFKARLPDYYAATITCEGNYRLVSGQNDIVEDLRVAGSDVVPEGPGVYRLGVLLQGDGFSLYVNGTHVYRLPVDGIGEVAAGEFGVLARSVESHQLQLEWDNLIATELQP